MVGRNRGRQVLIRRPHKIHGLFCGDVLQNHFEVGVTVADRLQRTLNKHGLSIKHIHVNIRNFPMDQQGHTDAFHHQQNTVDVSEIRYTCCGVGRGICRIKLGCSEHTLVKPPFNLIRGDVVGEISRH